MNMRLVVKIPSSHIPDSHIPVTAARDKGIAPRHHSPDTHDMALQTSQMPTLGVKNVNLCVVKGHNNILVCQVQASNHTLIRCNLPLVNFASDAPSRLDLVALLEM